MEAFKVVGPDYRPNAVPRTCPPWLNRSIVYTVGSVVVDTTTSGIWAYRSLEAAAARWRPGAARGTGDRVIRLEYEQADVAKGLLVDGDGITYWHRSISGEGHCIRLLRATVAEEIPREQLEREFGPVPDPAIRQEKQRQTRERHANRNRTSSTQAFLSQDTARDPSNERYPSG